MEKYTGLLKVSRQDYLEFLIEKNNGSAIIVEFHNPTILMNDGIPENLAVLEDYELEIHTFQFKKTNDPIVETYVVEGLIFDENILVAYN